MRWFWWLIEDLNRAFVAYLLFGFALLTLQYVLGTLLAGWQPEGRGAKERMSADS